MVEVWILALLFDSIFIQKLRGHVCVLAGRKDIKPLAATETMYLV